MDDTVRQFWEIEEIPPPHVTCSPDEKCCDEHFEQTFTREPSGRFTVRLPLKEPLTTAEGLSTRLATPMFKSLERKLAKNDELKKLYTDFMQEYEDLGHMSVVHPPPPDTPSWHLPHHGILQQSGLKKKLRVVFNGAAHNHVGRSLNDYFDIGPALQQDLFLLILN